MLSETKPFPNLMSHHSPSFSSSLLSPSLTADHEHHHHQRQPSHAAAGRSRLQQHRFPYQQLGCVVQPVDSN